VAGLASNTLHTTTHAGDRFTVYAKIVSLISAGQTTPYDGVEVKVPTVTVIPGKTSAVAFSATPGHLVSDGQSTTKITITARDAEGNPVAKGTDVAWDLVGGGGLSDAQTTIQDGGQASVTLRAGILPEDQKVTATVDGQEYSTTVTSDKVKILIGITGNVLTLGTGETATVTASVTDASGNPVPDGTPITWYSQKGTIAGQPVTVGGSASASLSAIGGSQIPGAGYVRAFVGGNAGASSYLWVQQNNGLSVVMNSYVLAGNKTTGGSFPVAQADGTTADYPYQTTSQGTITGTPNAVIRIAAGSPGFPPTGILSVTGDDGVPGSTTTVTLDAQGRGVFQVQSLGGVNGGLSLPITLAADLTTTVTMALQTDEMIARSQDMVKQAGWAVLTGEADGGVGMAADLAFSLIPVVGAYTDLRDMGKELLKLAPGDARSPNWFVFGFAAVGIAGSFLGPQVDWLSIIGKKLAAVFKPSGAIWASVWGFAKKADVSNLDEVQGMLTSLVDPKFADLAGMADDILVKSPDDLLRLNNLFKGLGADQTADLFRRIKANPDLGEAVLKKAMDTLGALDATRLAAINGAGKMDEVLAAIKFDIPTEKLDAYAKWLDDVKVNPSASIPFSSADDVVTDSYLVAKGQKVEPNLLAEEWVGNRAGRQADRKIDGVLRDYKTPQPGASSNTIQNEIESSVKMSRGQAQARNWVINARKTTLTDQQIREGVQLAKGRYRNRIDSVMAILPDGTMITIP